MSIERYLRKNDLIENLIITGFGIGGAYASICSSYLDSQQCQLHFKNCITFGEPKVGNTYYIHRFNAANLNYMKWVYKNDPVPRLPFNYHYELYHQYEHVIDTVPLVFNPNFTDNVISHVIRDTDFDEHDIENYVIITSKNANQDIDITSY